MQDRTEKTGDACDDALGLEGAIAELRTGVPARGAFRERLHGALAEEVAAAPVIRVVPRRGWHVRPLVAAAAAIGFTVLGAAGGSLLGSRAVRDGAGTAPGSVAATDAAPPATLRPVALTGDADVGVRFAVVAPTAARVSLVGDFNAWDPTATPLLRSRDGGTWSILLPLGAGRHTYAFVIDGEIVADPVAPSALEDDFGTPSSFVLVGNSVASSTPNAAP